MPNGACIMIQPSLNKQALQLLNNQSLRYNIAIAEKDYFLTLVSKIINESELSKKIVFKGGTAIHHCYLPQLRFSEDLDFSSLTQDISLNEVKAIFTPYDYLDVKESYQSKATIKIQRLKYSGVLDQPNSLKVEIDFIQNIILPAKTLPYNNVWGVDVSVIVMDEREICAEKIRAMSDRPRFRDFFDFYLLMKKFHFDIEEILNLLRQKEIRKVISKESILANFKQATNNKQDELGLIFYKQDNFDNDDKIRTLVESLDFDPIPVNSVFQK
jgi:predicted nucleotidyltransferase component of viral defense system